MGRRNRGEVQRRKTYVTVLACITVCMPVNRIRIVIIKGNDRVEGPQTTQVLADNSSWLYILPREHSVAPSRRPNYKSGVFHILEIRLGNVNTRLPVALERHFDLVLDMLRYSSVGQWKEGNSTHSRSWLVTHNTFHVICVEAENTLDGVNSIRWSRSISSVDASVIGMPCIAWY